MSARVRGAEGDRLLGTRLDVLTGKGAAVLHDWPMPGGRECVDHVLLTSSGLYVVDAVRTEGAVSRRDVGGFFRAGPRLYVGRRDCTKLVVASARKAAAVRQALDLGAGGSEVPVTPILCFVDAEWGLFARSLHFGDVVVTWPNALVQLATRPGAIPAGEILERAATLARSLYQART